MFTFTIGKAVSLIVALAENIFPPSSPLLPKPMLDIPKVMPATNATSKNTTAKAIYHGLAVEDSSGFFDTV